MRRVWTFLHRVDRELWWALALSTFAWMPLLAPGYFFQAHDAPHTVFFLHAFDKTLRDGYLIPRWATDFALGYGYPLFIFYAPLAYYVAEAFHLLGAGLTVAVKLTYLVGFILSTVSMYFLGRRLFGRSAGLLAAVLYTYVPYHLVDVYVRCDLAESFAYIFLPLTLLAMLEVVERGGRRPVALAGLAYAGLLLTHNGTALVFSPLLAGWVLFLLARQGMKAGWGRAVRSAGASLAAGLLGVGVSGFFLLPALLERGYIVQEQWIQGSFGYYKHFVFAGQLLSSFWGYGYAGEGLADEMPFQLGLFPLFLSMAAVTLRWHLPRRRAERTFFLAASGVVILFMLPFSAPLWRAIPLAALVQFPWRLLILTAVTLSLLGATLAADGEGSRPAISPAMVLAVAVAAGSFAYTLPQYTPYSARAEADVAVVEFELVYPPDRTGMMAWTKEQPMTSPLVPQYLVGEPLTKAHILEGQGSVEMRYHGGATEEVLVQALTPVTLEFYTYYFPGWRAMVDGEPVEIWPTDPYGLIALRVPAGEHVVRLRFGDTLVRLAGKGISLVSLLAAGWLLWPARRRTAGTGASDD
ncbi:MAG: glycosyltransferase family 39 protein [Anaerolineae bacterium]|nr:glycosyltransferase family 39 protein [Anaerolineae bacterium]